MSDKPTQPDMQEEAEKHEDKMLLRLNGFDSFVALHALVDLLNSIEGIQYEFDRRDVGAILSVILRAVDADLRMALS